MSYIFFTGFSRSTNYRRIDKLNARIYQPSSFQDPLYWNIDISSFLRENRPALRQMKEKLETEGYALFEIPPPNDHTILSEERVDFCNNVVAIIKLLEKRFSSSIRYQYSHYTESQKQYLESASARKEHIVRLRELSWHFMLKHEFYRPLWCALEQTRFTLQDFCRSVSIINETLTDILMTQNKCMPGIFPKFAGEIECLPEHVECFQVFINIL